MRTSQKNAITKTLTATIQQKVNLKTLGNSNRTLKDLCADLINNSTLDTRAIADQAYLNAKTVQNLASGKTQWPRADTCERVLRVFELSLSADNEPLKPTYKNQKK